jgi:hypothetical protein
MAGLDYSGVIEPDYDPDRLKQSVSVTDKIKKTVDLVNSYWNQKTELRLKAGSPGDLQIRHREIFYDTDNIFERQKEKVRVCHDCGGSFEIESTATPGNHILAVHIPINACHACIEAGYKFFDQADKSKFDRVFLQDRPKDSYEIK